MMLTEKYDDVLELHILQRFKDSLQVEFAQLYVRILVEEQNHDPYTPNCVCEETMD